MNTIDAKTQAVCEFMTAEFKRTGRVQDDSEATPEQLAALRVRVFELMQQEDGGHGPAV